MTTLHIVSSSPSSTNALDVALSVASKDDAIILIENGIYGSADTQVNRQRLESAAPELSYFVLKEDLSARALFVSMKDFQVVSYVEFVALVCQHNNSVSWS